MRARTIDLAAAGTLTTALVAAVVVLPDAVQGDLQRIMYVHVPSAWVAYLSFFVTFVASIAYLRTRALRWDHLAGASGEVGVVFTGLALATGSIWGKPVWGIQPHFEMGIVEGLNYLDKVSGEHIPVRQSLFKSDTTLPKDTGWIAPLMKAFHDSSPLK